MVTRVKYQSADDIGVYAKLTNSYCLVPIDPSENFYNEFEVALDDSIPLVHTSIADIQSVGRMTVGNRHGLLLPRSTTDNELRHLTNSMPDGVVVQKVEERLCALGNTILCNDYVALVHPDLDKATVDLIEDTLQVKVFRYVIGDQKLCGSYAVLTNKGCLVHPGVSTEQMAGLAALLNVRVCAGTVNRGVAAIGGGLVANDWTAFCGQSTTATEQNIINNIFALDPGFTNSGNLPLRDALIEAL